MKKEAKGQGTWDECKHRPDEGVGEVCQHDWDTETNEDLVH